MFHAYTSFGRCVEKIGGRHLFPLPVYTSFVTSLDGVCVAYNVNGTGTPVVLLHGGLQNRQIWHTTGYVDRLKSEFKVVAVDLRGNGESDKPTAPEDYTINKHCQDILAAANACGIDQFALWGFSLGGNIGRYLAAQSPRVTSLIMIGVSFGLGASGEFRQFLIKFRDHWQPILQAQTDGTLDIQSLSEQDQEQLKSGNMPLIVAQGSGMLEWGSIEPADVRCPTLWLAGSKNEFAMAGIREYEAMLKGSKVQVHVVEELDHMQELTEMGKVLPIMRSFTQHE
jgi:pimeloyl-ACP methyl ester carboxylesterase